MVAAKKVEPEAKQASMKELEQASRTLSRGDAAYVADYLEPVDGEEVAALT